MDFFAILRCDTRLYHAQGGATALALVACLRAGTAIGFRAFREHCPNFLSACVFLLHYLSKCFDIVRRQLLPF